MHNSSGFVKSAIATRIFELYKSCETDINTILKNELEEAVSSAFSINTNTDIDKLSKVLVILKANEDTKEISTCIGVLEDIIKNAIDMGE